MKYYKKLKSFTIVLYIKYSKNWEIQDQFYEGMSQEERKNNNDTKFKRLWKCWKKIIPYKYSIFKRNELIKEPMWVYKN